ncbi:MAG: alpha/beta hydrolase [Saprospiraceae bacterium]|jgi:2-hydroxy-6-oxonona-2,4-dienedioate hydrolase|uniref:Alpha/beta hydrolase n=1 Tax=Candidatus Defluviibacterium haderslevense TaxID=2981993 RepID=A0A9D7S5V6_9BACT|nr:alpha/beta hydrolase [Candidatus Defluviibacterium haderslevense]MBL0238774.1 alpha/beta hydrolase [Candidatus Defluviibacterium haderslevense]MCI1268187.1 alpha/beta hydrolase [Saprospiraceae bacterium]
MEYTIVEEGKFKYIESEGTGPVLMLLHGLLGALSNFKGIIEAFKDDYKVVVPILPIYEMPLFQVSVTGLVDYVAEFVKYKNYNAVNVLGNSLGGHIGLLYTLAHQDKVSSLILTGSSGLFESGMGNTFPKRGDYEFIKKKAEDTFYDPAIATKELIDELYNVVNDRNKAIRIVATAKSAIRHNLGDKLHLIKIPVLLIWGKEDSVTPPFVGEKFEELLPDAKLYLIDKCGHAPMMEKPDEFNEILKSFLEKNT